VELRRRSLYNVHHDQRGDKRKASLTKEGESSPCGCSLQRGERGLVTGRGRSWTKKKGRSRKRSHRAGGSIGCALWRIFGKKGRGDAEGKKIKERISITINI